MSDDLTEVQVAATIGLIFARDCTAARPGTVLDALGGACLALDVSEPSADFYRPQIRQQCRDGFLPLGAAGAPRLAFGDIVTRIDDQEVHRWSLDRLVRPLEPLVCEVSAFMTLRAGDLLLVGLAGDAPRARVGQRVWVESEGLPALQTLIQADQAS